MCWGRGPIPNSGCNDQLIATDGKVVTERTSDRYQLLGRLDRGDISLTILNITELDSGQYGCRVHISGIFNDQKDHIQVIVETGEKTFNPDLVFCPLSYSEACMGPPLFFWIRPSHSNVSAVQTTAAASTEAQTSTELTAASQTSSGAMSHDGFTVSPTPSDPLIVDCWLCWFLLRLQLSWPRQRATRLPSRAALQRLRSASTASCTTVPLLVRLPEMDSTLVLLTL